MSSRQKSRRMPRRISRGRTVRVGRPADAEPLERFMQEGSAPLAEHYLQEIVIDSGLLPNL